MDYLLNHVESLIFCSTDPIPIDEIRECLSEMFDADVPQADIEAAIQKIEERYSEDMYSFSLVHHAGGYQFLTKPAYQASISILLKQKSKKRLSTSAMETLAIIAYKQPMTKTEVEHIRGVNCDYSIQKLLDKELLEIQGKAETVGKPLLYGTSPKFMEYFGINSLGELPQLKDLVTQDNEIGTTTEKEEEIVAPSTQEIPEGESTEEENPQDSVQEVEQEASPEENAEEVAEIQEESEVEEEQGEGTENEDPSEETES